MREKFKEFKEADKAFEEKYKDVIYKIADHHGVDIGVGTAMFKTNLYFDAPIYEGGGVVESERWAEMLEDYKNLRELAIKSINE